MQKHLACLKNKKQKTTSLKWPSMMTQVGAMICFQMVSCASLQILLFGSGSRPQGSSLASLQTLSLRWDPMRDNALTTRGDDDALFPASLVSSSFDYYEYDVLFRKICFLICFFFASIKRLHSYYSWNKVKAQLFFMLTHNGWRTNEMRIWTWKVGLHWIWL